MIQILLIVLGLIAVVAAYFAVVEENLLSAIIAAGVVSLLASVIYLVLGSPDVAMTEAAIGSGLTTVIFLYTLNKIRKTKGKDDD